jgi:hypothetical protein
MKEGSVAANHLPEGEGLGGSLPDSIIVGRMGPMPSRFVPRDFDERGELLCSAGISLLIGLGVSTTTAGFGAGALSPSGAPVLRDGEVAGVFDPPAARAPASRMSSSVSVSCVERFSRGFDFRGFGVAVSGVISSEGRAVCCGGADVCFRGSDFFSRATITSCA